MSISAEKKQQLETERRSQIQSAALQMFFEKGYKNTSMNDISAKAGISKGLIYHYFKNKEDLFFSLQEMLQDCLDEIEVLPTPKATIREFGRRFLTLKPDETGYLPPLQVLVVAFVKGEMEGTADAQNPFLQDFGRSYFANLCEQGMKTGEFREMDPAVCGNIYWSYLVGRLMILMQEKSDANIAADLDSVLALFE